MAATRPGNRDRGWNDPPMFMYNADGPKVQSSSVGLKKSQLTQRVAMPENYGSPIPKTETNPSQPQRTTLVSGSPPRFVQVGPPQGSSCPPTSPTRSRKIKVEASNKESLPEAICSTSMAKLTGVLQKCQMEMKVRVADDIKKKLEVLEEAWNSSKLSVSVQQRMSKLATALADGDYGTAHDLHLSLMVDYVSEVSQWMVGIKRLIMEARTVLPHRSPETSSMADGEPHAEDSGKQIKPNQQDCPGESPEEPDLASHKGKTEYSGRELESDQGEAKLSENHCQSKQVAAKTN